jgi:hypothetical protein
MGCVVNTVDWGVVSFVLAALIGAGFGVLSMSPPQHTLAEIFFSVAAVILLSRSGWWLLFEHSPAMPIARTTAHQGTGVETGVPPFSERVDLTA